MSVVGIIIPVGYFHAPEFDKETTIYPMPIKLAEPALTFGTLPAPTELVNYFESIVEDVKMSYEYGHVQPQPGEYCHPQTSFIHVSHIEMMFYEGLQSGSARQVWHRMLHMTEGDLLAHYRFDGAQAFDAVPARL